MLNSETAPTAPTQMLGRDRMVSGKPPRPPSGRAAPPPRRIPLTKEQTAIGRVLLSEGPITSDFVRSQIKEGGLQNSLLAKAIAASGHVPEPELITLLLTGYRIPKVRLANYHVPQKALTLLPNSLVRKHNLVPLGKIGSIICIAVGSIFEFDVAVIREIRQSTGCLVKVFQSSVEDVQSTIEKFFPAPRRPEVPAEVAPAGDTAGAGLVAAVKVFANAFDGVLLKNIPHQDTAEYWEKAYASKGPVKALELEDS